jgi:hypothetical protein
MTPRSLVAAAILVATVPAGSRAVEWDGSYYDDAPSDYDVSVDVGGEVTFDTFEAPLSSYGEWVVAGNYGRVWRPRVAAGWRPYYYGRWEWTNEGWLWVSDEPWGWAAYHYGRWAHDPYYGWIWVPGYEWAPAWVSWRTSGDAIGWAPLAPGLSVYVTAFPFVDFWWTFVPTARFVSVPVYSVAYAPAYTRRWYRATAPSPARPAPRPGPGRPAPARTLAWGGPAPRLVAERTGRPLVPARIVAAPSPATRARPGEISVYRPGPRASVRSPNGGRGPGAAPAPGRGPERALVPAPRPPPGRGPESAAPVPRERDRARERERERDREPAAAPPPARGGRSEERSSAPPAWRPGPRGGGRGERDADRGERAAPAPRPGR